MTERLIPTQVSLDDFLEAIKPLLDLCGVTAEETYADVQIHPGGRTSEALHSISLTVVARREGDDALLPEGIRLATAQEDAELCFRARVDVMP